MRRAFGYFVKSRKIWALPKRSKIVVVEAANSSALVPLFRGEPFFLIDLDGGEIYCAPPILALTIIYWFRHRHLKMAYALALLYWVRPAVVVTYIDNSFTFQKLARVYRLARFIAIQNGHRLLDRDNPPGSPKIYHSEFVCLGEFEVNQFTKHGAIVEKFYPVGSLIDSYYRESRHRGALRKRFDLCLISQIRSGMERIHSERLLSFQILTKHLRQFCQIHNKNLCVAMRRNPRSGYAAYEWESAWFREYLGSGCDLIPNVKEEFTSYQCMDASRISVGMHSTMMREGFGRGNKILSCNFTGNATYDFPVPGLWTMNDPSYDAFEQRLLRLLNVGDNEYRLLCGSSPKYLLGYDDNTPTHLFVGDLIADALHDKKRL
jgi:surface carbohydrate biosynthesis protein